MWAGDPSPINGEVRAQKGRRELTWDKVADIIPLKRQALARRLNAETPWRYSELKKLNQAWDGALNDIVGQNPENGTNVSGTF